MSRHSPRSARSALCVALGVACAVSTIRPTVLLGRSELPSPADSAKASDSVQGLRELEQWVEKHGGKLSACAIDLESGRQLLQSAAEVPLNPASNMKLITAAAALDLLGPNFVFQTSLYGDVRADRVAHLGLKGTGDPSLSEPQLWRLANSLAARGAKRVGEIVVDQSHFDDQFVPPAFEQQPNEWAPFRAPVSAIALERNTLTLNILPTEAQTDARAWLEPKGVASLDGSIRTLDAGKGEQVRFQLESKDGALIARIGGHLAAGLPRQRFTKRVDDPRLLPGLNLRAHLLQLGVEVGAVRLGTIGKAPRITFTASPPLGELLKELGKHSDNFYAEMLFKSLAISESAEPRSFAVAAKVVSAWLSEHAASPPETRIINGSGLFDANRVSARSLVKVLEWAYREPRIQGEFVPHLAIGGVDGTLRSRFTSPPSVGRVRAKTGTLRDAVSLSGYALSKAGSAPVAFSFIVTGISAQHAAIRSRIDGVVRNLLD